MQTYSVETKVLAGFGAALGVLFVILELAYTNSQLALDQQRWATHSYNVIATLEQILARTYEAESSQRGYVLTGNAQLRRRRDAAIAGIEPAITNLGSLLADNPTQRQRVPEIRSLTSDRIRLFTDTPADGAAAARAAAPLMARLRDLTRTMQQDEERLRREREQTSAARARLNDIVLWSLAIAVTAFIAFVFLRIRSDIRARATAERGLRESEERFRLLVSGVRDYAIFMLDPAGHVASWNTGAERIKGYRAEEILGLHFSRFYPAEDIASGKPQYELETAAREGSFEDEGWRLRKDGSRFWANVIITAMRDESGALRGFAKVTRDFTERKNAEDRLAEANAFLDSVIENLPTMVLVKDAAELRVVRMNKAGETLLGRSRADLLGKNDADLRPRHEAEVLMAQDRETLAHGTLIDIPEETLNTRDNGPLVLHTRKVPILDNTGHARYMLSISEDITERKHTERVLARNAQREETRGLALALCNSVHDRDHILSGVLSLLAEQHGFTPGAVYLYDEWANVLRRTAVQGTATHFVPTLHPGISRLSRAFHDRQTLELENDESDMTLGNDAQRRPDVMLVVPITFMERCLGLLVLGTSERPDHADRVFLERLCAQLGVTLDNVKQYNDLKLLAEQLRLRSEEIANKNQQLAEANRMKSEFLANMSHELRTPLNAIIGFSELLRDGMLGWLNPMQRDHVHDIFNSGQHLLAVISDILDLSKIEAGYLELELGPVAVDGLIHASLSVIKEKASAHRLALDVKVDADIRPVLLDQRRVRQIVYNLMSNAVKFTPEGGRIAISARRVPAAPGQELEQLEISVSDTGIGISKRDQGRLFRPFTQIDSSLSRRHPGTGLGLVMVRRLAELHGGSVSLESKPGQGSSFRVRVPYREAVEIPAPVPKKQAADTNPGVPFALVVEDEDAAAHIAQLYLEQEGIPSRRVRSAEAALKVVGEQRPDVIILDVLLPGMDGWDFLTRLKALEGGDSIPVVIISIVADQRRGFSLGAVNVLQKPVTRSEIQDTLRELGLAQRTSAERRDTKILVVDDDPKAVEIIATHLEAAQYQVRRAYGGREAIQLIDREVPNLLILDLMMPDTSGFDVVKHIRADAHRANVPILILTAKLLTEDNRRWLNGDVQRIVEKSEFSGAEFLSEVRRALSLWPRNDGAGPGLTQ